MEYNLKEVLKNLFINLVVTFVVAFVFDYFNINNDRHGSVSYTHLTLPTKA